MDSESQSKTEKPYTRPSKQLSHHYRPAFSFSSSDTFIVLFRANLEGDLFHSCCSPVGWPDNRASPERDTWNLCVLLSFRRAKLGRKAVEYGTSVPVTLPHGMGDGSTQMPLAVQPQDSYVVQRRDVLTSSSSLGRPQSQHF